MIKVYVEYNDYLKKHYIDCEQSSNKIFDYDYYIVTTERNDEILGKDIFEDYIAIKNI